MNYKIIPATPLYADKFRLMCQRTFEMVYPNKERGITKELFSKDIFNKDPGILAWWNELASPRDDLQTWFAIDEQDNVVGGVVAQKYPEYTEMKTFYVAPEHQGKGIGRELYDKVLAFADSQPIQVDVVEYLDKTIKMYKHWGFKIDQSKGTTTYPWSLWPKEAVEAYKGIYMVKEGQYESNSHS